MKLTLNTVRYVCLVCVCVCFWSVCRYCTVCIFGKVYVCVSVRTSYINKRLGGVVFYYLLLFLPLHLHLYINRIQTFTSFYSLFRISLMRVFLFSLFLPFNPFSILLHLHSILKHLLFSVSQFRTFLALLSPVFPPQMPFHIPSHPLSLLLILLQLKIPILSCFLQ